MESGKGNVMVVGKTGSGKTAISVDVVRTFLSEQQPGDVGELRKGIEKNGKKPGRGHHEK